MPCTVVPDTSLLLVGGFKDKLNLIGIRNSIGLFIRSIVICHVVDGYGSIFPDALNRFIGLPERSGIDIMVSVCPVD